MMKFKSKKFIAMMMSVLVSVNSLPMTVLAVETEVVEKDLPESLESGEHEEEVFEQEYVPETEIVVHEVTRETVLDEEMEEEKAIELLADETIIASGTCGADLTWSLDQDGLLIIRGTGPMDDYTDSGVEAPWHSNRDSIISVVIENSVTSIGDFAFWKCTNLISAEIADTVTYIGLDAFDGCNCLTTVNIPYGVTRIGRGVFDDCSSLLSIEIPDSVTSIDLAAFNRCSSLTNVVLPDSVTNIGTQAFSRCSNLSSITLGTGLMSIGNRVFEGCYNLTEINVNEGCEYFCSKDGVLFDYNMTTLICFPGSKSETSYIIPDSVTTICGSAFYRCSNLTNIEMPGGLTTIGYEAFFDCYNLLSINIPDSVTSIEEGAFCHCESLTSINLSDGMATIEKSTFSDCESLTNVVLGNNIVSIGIGAFGGCEELVDIELPTSLTSIGASAFWDCKKLAEIELPTSLTSIGASAFYGCGNLLQINIPDGVTSIGSSAFEYCSILESVNIPDSLNRICQSTFFGCHGLKDINIPSSIEFIESYAFAECYGMNSIIFEGSAPEFGEDSFCDTAVTAYYPGNDPSWTSEVKQSYGGTLIWAAYDKEVAEGNTGDLKWILKESGILIISGEGEMPDYNLGTMPWNEYSKQITQVVIEEGVTRIGAYTFAGCSSLDSIFFEGSAPEFGENCFYGVTAIVYYPDNDSSWAEDDRQDYGGTLTWVAREKEIAKGTVADLTWVLKESGVLTISGQGEMASFEDMPWSTYAEQILQVVIEDGVTSIGNLAFYGCHNLEHIEIPDSITSIGDSAFESCSTLTRLDIPANVTKIGKGVFYSCGSLTEINVKTENKNYCSRDGVLFDHEMKTIICFPAGKTDKVYNIPDGVTKIAPYAFFGCFPLENVNIPDGMVTIGESAFSYVHCLENVNIPASVERIGNSVFSFSGLNNIYFEGEAPEFACDCFWKVTATAYYPANDPSWTDEVRQNYDGTITWKAYEKTESKLEIITQPVDFTGKVGDMAQFTIEAEGEGLTYQWQYCNNGSGTWRNSSMTGADTNTIEVSITEARIGQKYRCVVTDARGTELISNEATLLKTAESFEIISQPENYTGNVGEEAKFAVKATGEGLKYQWQYCNPGSKSWKNSSMKGYKTAELTVQITEARIGQKYRCVITDASGTELISNEAILLKTAEPFEIISHPENYTGNAGEEAKFAVKATGEGLKYQWQYCNPGSKRWNNSSMKGYKTAELTVQITEARIGQKYRCVITDASGTELISNEAEIVKPAEVFAIISHPDDYAGNVGEEAKFAVKATGENLKYQWQYCNPRSKNWKNSSMKGYKTAELTVQITEARIGQKYRCVIIDGNGDQLITNEAEIVRMED